MYEEIFGGLTQTAEEPLSKTFHVKDNAMVLEKDITFYSTNYSERRMEVESFAS